MRNLFEDDPLSADEPQPPLPSGGQAAGRTGAGTLSIRYGDRYLPGNRLELYGNGGEAFGEMLRTIAAARETVHLETYRLASDKTGWRFCEALCAKAKDVQVRLIYDSLGSRGISAEMITRLRNSGVQLLEYHPVSPWRSRGAWGRRDHRKILAVDGRIAFAGSLNISDVHVPASEGGQGWRDAHVKVEGRAAREIDALFREVWTQVTGRSFDLAPVPSTVGNSYVWPAANQEILHRYHIRSSYLAAIRSARKEVLLAHAYFLPDQRFRRALASAALRGVSVRILVPGASDVPPVWYASRAGYGTLLRRGVRLFEWQGPILHSKVAVVDRLWTAIGSYNIDHRSLRHNLELNLHVLDAEFASRVAEIVEGDMGRSTEITRDKWRLRGWSHRAFERFFAMFRYLF